MLITLKTDTEDILLRRELRVARCVL